MITSKISLKNKILYLKRKIAFIENKLETYENAEGPCINTLPIKGLIPLFLLIIIILIFNYNIKVSTKPTTSQS